METTYNWTIVELERELSDGYVYTVHWSVTATDGELSAGSYGSIGLSRPEEELIPFEDLDEDTVVQWTKDALGEDQVTNIETSLASQIEAQRTPKTSKGLPW